MSSASQALWAAVAADLTSTEAPADAVSIQLRRRRGFDAVTGDGLSAVRLVRDDGLLRWVYEPPAQQRGDGGRRAWRAFGGDPRDTVQRIAFPELGSNQITTALQALDARLNPVLKGMADPRQGLRRWQDGRWQAAAPEWLAGLQGPVLVLVHGTFSKSAMYSDELTLAQNPDGRRLWSRLTTAGAPYAAVLAFDHPTLSVSPWLNALALRDALQPCRASFDFLAHSRGGLVVSWLLRMVPPDFPARRAVFVGSPLAGTSLAAPDKLRQALDTLASVADALTEGAKLTGQVLPAVAPLAYGVAGLATVLGKVLQLGAKLPLADAAVGLVPGLLAQGRVDNNLELQQLYPLRHDTEVLAIGGSFMPTEVNQPLWKLWKRFGHLKDQGLYYGADLIFNQPNDLVVDSASMNRFGSTDEVLAAPQWEDLGPSDRTHHCSYFQDERVIGWLERRLS